MKKALKILKNTQSFYEEMGKFVNYDVEQKEIDEAIAELEALEYRSCDNCKNAYYQDVTNDLDDDVYSCDEFESSFININDSGRPKDFSCKKWESK